MCHNDTKIEWYGLYGNIGIAIVDSNSTGKVKSEVEISWSSAFYSCFLYTKPHVILIILRHIGQNNPLVLISIGVSTLWFGSNHITAQLRWLLSELYHSFFSEFGQDVDHNALTSARLWRRVFVGHLNQYCTLDYLSRWAPFSTSKSLTSV